MKGQYFSFDAVVGASIFILTLIAIMSYWYGVSNSIEQQQSSLAKEAIRIADILYAPQEVPYGLALGWNDKHLNQTKMEDLCFSGDPRDALGSAYNVSIRFQSAEEGGSHCIWGEDYIVSSNIYKMRRVASFYTDSAETQRGYIDIYVYEPVPGSP